MKLHPVLLEILVCPDCKGRLSVDEEAEELVCDSCGLAYPVRDDIPVMLVDEARRPDGLPPPAPDRPESADALPASAASTAADDDVENDDEEPSS